LVVEADLLSLIALWNWSMMKVSGSKSLDKSKSWMLFLSDDADAVEGKQPVSVCPELLLLLVEDVSSSSSLLEQQLLSDDSPSSSWLTTTGVQGPGSPISRAELRTCTENVYCHFGI